MASWGAHPGQTVERVRRALDALTTREAVDTPLAEAIKYDHLVMREIILANPEVLAALSPKGSEHSRSGHGSCHGSGPGTPHAQPLHAPEAADSRPTQEVRNGERPSRLPRARLIYEERSSRCWADSLGAFRVRLRQIAHGLHAIVHDRQRGMDRDAPPRDPGDPRRASVETGTRGAPQDLDELSGRISRPCRSTRAPDTRSTTFQMGCRSGCHGWTSGTRRTRRQRERRWSGARVCASSTGGRSRSLDVSYRICDSDSRLTQPENEIDLCDPAGCFPSPARRRSPSRSRRDCDAPPAAYSQNPRGRMPRLRRRAFQPRACGAHRGRRFFSLSISLRPPLCERPIDGRMRVLRAVACSCVRLVAVVWSS